MHDLIVITLLVAHGILFLIGALGFFENLKNQINSIIKNSLERLLHILRLENTSMLVGLLLVVVGGICGLLTVLGKLSLDVALFPKFLDLPIPALVFVGLFSVFVPALLFYGAAAVLSLLLFILLAILNLAGKATKHNYVSALRTPVLGLIGVSLTKSTLSTTQLLAASSVVLIAGGAIVWRNADREIAKQLLFDTRRAGRAILGALGLLTVGLCVSVVGAVAATIAYFLLFLHHNERVEWANNLSCPVQLENLFSIEDLLVSKAPPFGDVLLGKPYRSLSTDTIDLPKRLSIAFKVAGQLPTMNVIVEYYGRRSNQNEPVLLLADGEGGFPTETGVVVAGTAFPTEAQLRTEGVSEIEMRIFVGLQYVEPKTGKIKYIGGHPLIVSQSYIQVSSDGMKLQMKKRPALFNIPQCTFRLKPIT